MGAGASIPIKKIQKVKKLLENLNINNKDKKITSIINERFDDMNNTYLHYASSHNDISLARLLLGRGANPNVTNFRNITPLQYALNYNYMDIANLLVSHGATVTDKSIFPTAEYETVVYTDAHVKTRNPTSPKSRSQSQSNRNSQSNSKSNSQSNRQSSSSKKYPRATLVAGSKKRNTKTLKHHSLK